MLSQKSTLSKPILISLLLMMVGLAIAFNPKQFYINIKLTSPDNVQTTLLLSQSNSDDCHRSLNAIVNPLKMGCPTCRIQAQQCVDTLSPQQQNILSAAPLPFPSNRIENGVVYYESSDLNKAILACQNSDQKSLQTAQKVTCSPPNTSRPIQESSGESGAKKVLITLLLLVAAAVSSWFICFLIIRYEHLHAHFSHDHIDAGPQKFHAKPTPRIGGLAIFSGLLIAAWVEPVLNHGVLQIEGSFSYLLLAATPAFFGGIVEDISKNVGVAQRLLLTMISAAIASWLLGATLSKLDIPLLDSMLHWLPFAVAFTVFAVSGVANSINIIDGYNGLAGGFSIIVLIALSIIANMVNDNLVLTISISMTGALIGFLTWNWPKGKIFMGDGGAYLLGFILAELSVLLICRNPSVSPWFPLLLLLYPVFETFFSIYRRKWIRKSTPGHPDALHLHQLIFKRIVRGHIHSGQPDLITRNNSRTAPYIWFVATLNAIFAIIFWQNTTLLMVASISGCLLYILLYRQLVILRLWGLCKWLRKKQ